MTPALLSQEQMELLEKEYRFKNWREEDLSVLENLILSCSGKYKLFFIKGYLNFIGHQMVASKDDILLPLGEDNNKAREECRLKQQKYKQMLTHVIELLADDKTGVGNYLEGEYFFSTVLNEVVECLREILFEDQSVIIDGEEITCDDFRSAIQLYGRFNYSFNYQTRKEFVDLIKFAKIRDILKVLSDREGQQEVVIDRFTLRSLIRKNRLEEINQLMGALKSKNESEYQGAIKVLKKDLHRLAKGKSFANEEEKNVYINGTAYRFLISYILSNGQEDVWFNDYFPLVFQIKEDLAFLDEYGYIFNSLNWAERLISTLSENLKQNWAGVFTMQLGLLESMDKLERDNWLFNRNDKSKYSLLNITELDKLKLLSLINTSASVKQLQSAFEIIRKDKGYVTFVNTLTFKKSDEYKRLILGGGVKTSYELLSIVESLNFDDIKHISDNLFILLNGDEVRALAYGIKQSLKKLKEDLDKREKESTSEIDKEIIINDLRALEKIYMVLKDKLISGFTQVRQELVAGWFKCWLMGGKYREQLNDLNNKFTGFTVILPPPILEQVFSNRN